MFGILGMYYIKQAERARARDEEENKHHNTFVFTKFTEPQ